MEININKWVEEGGKRAKGQASFRAMHSTINRYLTLRHTIEKMWDSKEELWCLLCGLQEIF
jgi:hypothetical protein